MSRAPTTCTIDHDDATCTECGAGHVKVGWAHVCRPCWDAHYDTILRRYQHGDALGHAATAEGTP